MAKHQKSPLVGSRGEALASPVDHAAELWFECVRIAEGLDVNHVYQWTNAQRFAVALVAGASLVYRNGEIQTEHRLSFQEVGGRIRVTQAPVAAVEGPAPATPPPVRETKGVSSGAPPNPSESILARLLKCYDKLMDKPSSHYSTGEGVNDISDLLRTVKALLDANPTPVAPNSSIE